METEYVIRFRPRSEGQVRPTDERLFKKLAAAFRKTQPLVSSIADNDSYFAANGGGLSFERSLRLNGTGLIEGATPECFSPRDLLIAQRAQDQLLAESARTAGEPDSEFVLLKNNRDKNGHTFGCHENYETVFATGLRLRIWQAIVLLLYPLVLVAWALLMIAALVLILLSMFLGMLAFKIARRRFPESKERKLRRRYSWSIEDPGIWVNWNIFWQYTIFAGTMAIPIVIFTAFARWIAFHPVRGPLIKFLVTRPSWAGAGWLDTGNRYFIQQKPVKCLVGEGIIWRRPMIHIAHLVEILVVNPFNFKRYKTLLNSRQRMQIAFSDSNMCEEAEYLKVATTRLLLDAVEALAIRRTPRLWRPLSTAGKVCRGILKKPIASFGKRKLDAIEVQRFFYHEIWNYLMQNKLQNEETLDIFQRWKTVLDGLDFDRQSLVGRVDWVTKRYLLDELDPTLTISARRKVDFKYHELSPDGYYFRLAAAGQIRTLVTPEELERSKRLPPAGTRAAVRGRYIREFASSGEEVSMDWDSIVVWKDDGKKIIELPHEDET